MRQREKEIIRKEREKEKTQKFLENVLKFVVEKTSFDLSRLPSNLLKQDKYRLLKNFKIKKKAIKKSQSLILQKKKTPDIEEASQSAREKTRAPKRAEKKIKSRKKQIPATFIDKNLKKKEKQLFMTNKSGTSLSVLGFNLKNMRKKSMVQNNTSLNGKNLEDYICNLGEKKINKRNLIF